MFPRVFISEGGGQARSVQPGTEEILSNNASKIQISKPAHTVCYPGRSEEEFLWFLPRYSAQGVPPHYMPSIQVGAMTNSHIQFNTLGYNNTQILSTISISSILNHNRNIVFYCWWFSLSNFNLKRKYKYQSKAYYSFLIFMKVIWCIQMNSMRESKPSHYLCTLFLNYTIQKRIFSQLKQSEYLYPIGGKAHHPLSQNTSNLTNMLGILSTYLKINLNLGHNFYVDNFSFGILINNKILKSVKQ